MTRWWKSLPVAVLVALGAAGANPAQAADPELSVTVVEDGLEIPWDLAFLPATGSAIPSGSMLYTERSLKRVTLRLPDGTKRVVLDDPAGMWASGETGLMAVEADRDFATNRSFVTCHGYKSGSTQDVRVVRWQLDETFTRATLVKNLVTGLPSTSGRHGGCALVKGGGTVLYIGTGDAAVGKNPQNRASGGGKVLRVDINTGAGFKSNPYSSSTTPITKLIASYGHRNVQGLAQRADGGIWAVEQGSYRDDEVNYVTFGRNNGWNPVPRRSDDPSYNEGANSPMTDYALPGSQGSANWRSQGSTMATSGATFVNGSAWGSWNNSLAVANLKDQSVRFIQFDSARKWKASWVPAALKNNPTLGRLRAAVQGPDGSLYLTTSNGTDDKIVKVTPVAVR